MIEREERFDLIVFDWDGTLADSTGLITNSIREAFAELGLAVPTREDASFVIGLGLMQAMQYLAPNATPKQIEDITEAYKHHYLKHDGDILLFDGVVSTLPRLKDDGYLLAVATGKSRKGLDRALAHTGLGHYFDYSRCADECHSKPHPQMLEEITDRLGVEANRAVMIGDTTHDLQMALNAGTAALGVAYGAHPRNELAGLNPLAIFDTFNEFDSWMVHHG
jgi:phosphoglycolate phosphatase